MINSIQKKFQAIKSQSNSVIDNVEGRVGVPILMYFLGVPGGICLLVWLFFFRGK